LILFLCHWFWDFENGWSFDWATNGRDLLLDQKTEQSVTRGSATPQLQQANHFFQSAKLQAPREILFPEKAASPCFRTTSKPSALMSISA